MKVNRRDECRYMSLLCTILLNMSLLCTILQNMSLLCTILLYDIIGVTQFTSTRPFCVRVTSMARAVTSLCLLNLETR